MKLVIPSNWQPGLVERVRGPGAFTLYAALPSTIAGGGRPTALIPHVGRRRAAAHVAEAHRAGLRFEYVLNAPSLDNREFTRRGHRELRRLLAWIDRSGADGVTVSIPYLLQLVKRHHPRLRVTVSTIANVADPHRARHWEDLGADCITLSVINVGRSFGTIRAIRAAVDLELCVIANLTCAYQCPYAQYHSVTEGHASRRGHPLRGFFVDYCRASCIHDKVNEPARLVRSPWIRPEDQGIYEQLGVDRLKLVNRMMTTDQIGRITDAYRAKRHEGNLFELLDFPSKPAQATRGVRGLLRLARYFGRPDLVNVRKLKRSGLGTIDGSAFYLDNRQLDGFVSHFAEHDCAGTSCRTCGYCDEVAHRLLRIDPAARAMLARQTGRLREDLISGELFSWSVRDLAATILTFQREDEGGDP